MTRETSRHAPTFVARTPEDLLAVVPVVLGFAPTDSVVMLTFGGARPFHARVDLPHDPDDVAEVVGALVDPAVRHRVGRVVLVLYSGGDQPARRVANALARSLERSGIAVVDCLRSDGKRWFPLLGRHPGVPAHGVPYDVTGHRFAAEAVVEGFVTHASRDDLARSIAADPARVAALEAALAGVDTSSGSWRDAALRMIRLVTTHTGLGTVATDDELAQLVADLADRPVLDCALGLLDRETARADVAFWTDVVRRAPDELLTGPAVLLAFAAWLAGHGALAWCALDRVPAGGRDHALVGLVTRLLEQAVPPQVWGDLHTPGTDTDSHAHESPDVA
ncbi:hypothetical protein FB382_002113 [Nocardioides ginsengisegetis]|uniref:DUF4192 domain-containing protein n=1 Tax=Nocardioides ginsengisegetis TaxID=661491 RepID=A0A7W3J041_9ACTN|nr:DUF4192 domain-containing protein [Nocardioides ginsengisegetis]MBA8803822.1 hypothetical protein [Nocardioides ginsengisegetis]